MRKLVQSVVLIGLFVFLGVYACDEKAPSEPELGVPDQQQVDLLASQAHGGNPLLGSWRATSAVVGDDELLVGVGILYIMTFRGDGTHSVTVSNDAGNLVCPTTSSCSWDGQYAYTATTVTTIEPNHPDPAERGEDTSLYATCGGMLIFMDRADGDSGFRLTFQRTGEGR